MACGATHALTLANLKLSPPCSYPQPAAASLGSAWHFVPGLGEEGWGEPGSSSPQSVRPSPSQAKHTITRFKAQDKGGVW
jgi:hypothetical protein